MNKEVSEQYDIGMTGDLPVIKPENEKRQAEDRPPVKTSASRLVAQGAKPMRPSKPRPEPRPGGRVSKSTSNDLLKPATTRHLGALPRYGEMTKGRRAFEERQRALSAKERQHRIGEAFEIVRKAKSAEAKATVKRLTHARRQRGMPTTFNNVTSVTGKPRLGYKSRALSLARRQKIRMQTQRMLNDRRHQEASDDVLKASKLHLDGDEDRKTAWKMKSKLMKATNKALLRRQASELRDKLALKGDDSTGSSEVVPRVASVNKTLNVMV